MKLVKRRAVVSVEYPPWERSVTYKPGDIVKSVLYKGWWIRTGSHTWKYLNALV